MKDTGIVRKIDELGRIVIPKEIRRTLKLKVGTPVQIYINNLGELVLIKHSAFNNIKEFSDSLCQTLFEVLAVNVVVCNLDCVISTCSKAKQMLNKDVSAEVLNIIEDRKGVILTLKEQSNMMPIFLQDKQEYTSQIIIPVISDSEVIGAIIGYSVATQSELNLQDLKLFKTMASFMAKQTD